MNLSCFPFTVNFWYMVYLYYYCKWIKMAACLSWSVTWFYLASGLDDHDVIRLIQDADLTGLLDRLGGLDVPTDWNWYNNLSIVTLHLTHTLWWQIYWKFGCKFDMDVQCFIMLMHRIMLHSKLGFAISWAILSHKVGMHYRNCWKKSYPWNIILKYL